MGQVFGSLGYAVQLETAGEDSPNLQASPFETYSFDKKSPVVSTTAGSNTDQFRLFNLVADGQSHRFADAHETVPSVKGSPEQPDVRARIELLSFNPGPLDISDYDGATLRLDIGEDSLGSSALQPLFWSIAAGLDLAGLAGSEDDKKAPKMYNEDFNRALGNRPIEISGGLAELRFEVVLNKKKPWWRDIFTFLQSDTGGKAISAFGFPAIAADAIKIIDKAFDVLADDSKSLFRSEKMRFAMSGQALEDFTMGMPGIRLGVVNRGFALLAQQKHFKLIAENRPQYLASFGRLAPNEWSLEDYHNAKDTDNPFHGIPYAVLRIKSEAASLAGSL